MKYRITVDRTDPSESGKPYPNIVIVYQQTVEREREADFIKRIVNTVNEAESAPF